MRGVACGNDFTICLTEKRSVFGMGDCSLGQLCASSLSMDTTISKVPVELDKLSKYKIGAIAACSGYAAAITGLYNGKLTV